jgi:hypothetical protein
MSPSVISRIISIGLLVAAVVVAAASAAAQMGRAGNLPKIDCTECHVCKTPTADDPCLKACPRLFIAHDNKKHSVTEGPDMVVLNKLVDQYGAVHFNHKLHSEMAGMDKGCSSCHHYSPEGHIPSCGQCHGGETNPANLRQPGLKGAYHRQCIACHREWSHDTDCKICHMPLTGKGIDSEMADSTDIVGIPHPRLSEPVKKVYFTSYEKQPVVTFFHKQHTDLFSLRCVDCHLKEGCSNCHDLEKPTRVARTEEEVHAICSGCHAKDRCDKCHDNREKSPFMHATTGWPLTQYHAELECRACHPTGKRIGRLNSTCTTCHAGWNGANFEHAVTGLQLDETHAQAECSDCHADKKFDQTPTCGGCHDDNRSPTSNPPGKFVKARG